MTDTVTRLRRCGDTEAADEIERLQALAAHWQARFDKLEAERDALRELLRGMIGTPCPTPIQWKSIGEKAKELDAALGKERP